jgi:hypothetical protein
MDLLRRSAVPSSAFAFGVALLFATVSSGAAAADDPLVGAWVAPCHRTGLVMSRYAVDRLTITPEHGFSRDIRIFSGKDCADTALLEERQYTGDVSTTGPVLGRTKATDVTFRVDGVAYTAFGEAAAHDFSSSRVCGVAGWRAGEKRNVVGLACHGVTIQPGTNIYDLASVENGRLYLGNKSLFHTGAQPGERPTGLDREVPFVADQAAPLRTTH